MSLIHTAVLVVLFGLASLGAQAGVKFCGTMTSVGYENDIWSNYRVGLLNKEKDPSYVTIKDEAAVEQAMFLVAKNNASYVANYASFDWRMKDDPDNGYWVCLTGSDFTEYGPFVHAVKSMTVWHNGKRVLTYRP